MVPQADTFSTKMAAGVKKTQAAILIKTTRLIYENIYSAVPGLNTSSTGAPAPTGCSINCRK